jgi:hypothetical protein
LQLGFDGGETMTTQTKSAADHAKAAADDAKAATDHASETGADVASQIRDAASDAAGQLRDGAIDAASQIRASAVDAASALGEHAPAAVALSQDTIDRIAAQLKASSTDSLVLGTVFSAGVWCGLALARAPRLLMLLAILPALVLGGSLLSRRTPTAGIKARKR